jgi:hypothetical protein
MKQPSGKFVTIYGERFYEIVNYDAMQPFFISLASDSDVWIYLSSHGGLSAGRRNPDNALFPYYTDDKITDSADFTGSKTIIRLVTNGKPEVWEPFSERQDGKYRVERSIAKSTSGNQLLFKEQNHDLELCFEYLWTSSEEFGLVRKSKLSNTSNHDIEIECLDGLLNILPAGIDRQTQNEYSTLVDGYKKTELLPGLALALFRMEAILVDRAEPSECLVTNTVWSTGNQHDSYLLSTTQLKNFRSGLPVVPETESKGVRGAYLVRRQMTLHPGHDLRRTIVADLNKDACGVASLANWLRTGKNVQELLDESVARCTHTLREMVADADGIQHTADEHVTARHFSNVLFNLLRGGIYNQEYQLDKAGFLKHVHYFNRAVAQQHHSFLEQLPSNISHSELGHLILLQNDEQLFRLYQEYLPLTFSRRHGDPSRPWNNFNIRVKDDRGDKLISWQGNWRDIFQNWEALSVSFPGYTEAIIAKFLNATTIDGYNPYRITSEGIDWEILEPENPWSHIGYWGDHQLIYLLKLVELLAGRAPQSISTLIDHRKFAYANVPYRLKNYVQLIGNPKDTILFDNQLHLHIQHLETEMGADARLIIDRNGKVRMVSFTEKMLVTLLAKLTNLIPGAGIWMNTQRPEWNDANNALVGTGASMVTLYYLRRFVSFMADTYSYHRTEMLSVGAPVYHLLKQTLQVMQHFASNTIEGFDTNSRRRFTDQMGQAAAHYRETVYTLSEYPQLDLSRKELLSFFESALQHIDYSIEINRRNDKLFHSYNLVRFTGDEIEIRHLSEMLEGQVAVLSAGKLTLSETAEVLDALRASALYRPDQQSYMLYPNKQLPLFMNKNSISESALLSVPALKNKPGTIVCRDVEGNYHFNSTFHNAGFLLAAIEKGRKNGELELNDTEVSSILQLYEETFDHQSFTGRSGTFYKYEGLGSIYWHMVSKLALAIAETIERADETTITAELIERLREHYREIKKGIGAHKHPREYGSFPFDPYSHTPQMAGVQQPGMTGQVKEDILSRYMELGIKVENGRIHFHRNLLDKNEFIPTSNGGSELSFTYCSIPFVYLQDGKTGTEVQFTNGSTEVNDNYHLSEAVSRLIFERSKTIATVIVHL